MDGPPEALAIARDPPSARNIIAAAREQLGPSLLEGVIAGGMQGDGPRSDHELAARILDGTYVVVIHPGRPSPENRGDADRRHRSSL